ncbi:Dilute domain-containing protein C25B8,08 [Ceratobasidium sp. AG-Ba]|nr:Dilute domain-containing protein C25B8,08 [Ceratobasidium sp. AG-Ba]QRW14860.1 Dilute domain-containing protein C25B8,08 [Ceratobasidium sp. AG-Ba]
MASGSTEPVNTEHLTPSLPTPALLAVQLSSHSQRTDEEKKALVAHSLHRACLFGDQGLLTFLLHDPAVRPLVFLDVKDEDGVSLVSLTIQGFTPCLDPGDTDLERDVEREECVRLLVQQGADVQTGDLLGWTPLHYAAIHAPPTLVSYLATHGGSPFAKSTKGLTPLDIITGYDVIPGREDVALVLEEVMRASGWTGSARNHIRQTRQREEVARNARRARRRAEWTEVGRVLNLADQWWEGRRPGENQTPRIYLNVHDAEVAYQEEEEEAAGVSNFEDLDEDEDDPTGEIINGILSPPIAMEDILVYSPMNLPRIFYAMIDQAKPVVYPLHQRTMPANVLYALTRFAIAHTNDEWLEELIGGAATRIEETIRARKYDMAHLAFWLFNVNVLLHFVRCDRVVDERCVAIDADMILEDLINAIFVYIVRGIEQNIDDMIDTCFIEHAPLASEFESLQFEGEWSFFKSLTPKKRPNPPPAFALFSQPNGDVGPISPPPSHSGSRPESPNLNSSPTKKGFSLRNTLTRKQVATATSSGSLSALAEGNGPGVDVVSPVVTGPKPTHVTALLGASHTLLTLYGVNPTLIVQLFSQVLSWAGCEVFNRILTRKKYLCRSRAVQISMNISVVEEWAITDAGLPKGVIGHFAPAKELLRWLQLLSSIQEFPSLVATIQTFKSLNPLQMRRAARDYKYEKNEGRMDDECAQYLLQVQKDWERQRVKLGVAAIRQDISTRDREWEESIHTNQQGTPAESEQDRLYDEAQMQIDALFDRDRSKSDWQPPAIPEPLGELLDSRYMLPLILPSEPILLAAMPVKRARSKLDSPLLDSEGRSISRASQASAGATDALAWRTRLMAIREVRVNILDVVDYGWFAERRWSTKTYHDDPRSEAVSPVSSPLQGKRRMSKDEDEDDTPVAPNRINGAHYAALLTPDPPRRRVSDRRRSYGVPRMGRESSGGETIRPGHGIFEDEDSEIEDPILTGSPTRLTPAPPSKRADLFSEGLGSVEE